MSLCSPTALLKVVLARSARSRRACAISCRPHYDSSLRGNVLLQVHERESLHYILLETEKRMLTPPLAVLATAVALHGQLQLLHVE